jgi:hypothetical protein
VEDLRSTLATANDSDIVCLGLILQHIRQNSAVLGRVHDALILGETRRHLRLTTQSNDDFTRPARSNLTSLDIPRTNNKVFHNPISLLTRNNINDLLTVRNNVIKALRTPTHIILKLHTRRQKRAQVGKVDQTILVVQVIQESEAAARIAEGSQILDEGNLHARPGNQHTGVPGELLLALQEADLRLEVGVWGAAESGVHCVVERNSNGQGCGTESHAEKVVHFVCGCGAQEGAVGGGLNAGLHGVDVG